MYILLIARRYLFARWMMSGVAIFFVLIAVFSLIVVRSVFQGFGDQMRAMVRGTTSHLVLTTVRPMNLPFAEDMVEDLNDLPHVVGASPYVETMAMFQVQHAAGPYANYLQVRGIDPKGEATVGDLAYYLLRDEERREICAHPDRPISSALDRKPLAQEEIAYLFSTEHRNKVWERHKERLRQLDPEAGDFLEKKLPPPVIVGIQALLEQNQLVRYGSLIHLTTLSPQKDELIRSGEFLVVGAFHTGLFEADLRTMYMPLPAACEFIDLYDEGLPDADGFPQGGWRVSGISIAIDDYGRHKDDVKRAIADQVLPTYSARILQADRSVQFFQAFTATWEERKKNLLQAVEIEKIIVTVIIGMLMVFACLTIFLILTLNVTEKRRDIGILKAVGGHYRSIFTIFLLHGASICIIGLILGFLGGFAFTSYINEIHDVIHEWTGWQLFPPDIYYMDRIPVSLQFWDLVNITGFTVILGFLGSLLPAIWAARQDPMKAIRFE